MTFSCPICDGQQSVLLERAAYYVGKPPGVKLYRCKACGTVSSPEPGLEYDNTYYDRHQECVPGYAAHEQRVELFHQRAKYLAQHTDGSAILDIGCARGDFLDQAAAHGFKTYGVEISADAAQVAYLRGHKIINALAQKLPFPSGTFAAIHMNHVLEHVPTPIASLRDIRRMLKPGGLAVIEVPNELGTLSTRLKLAVGHLGVPGTERMSYAPHLIYFNMATLTRAMEQAGLRVIRRQTRFYGEITPRLSTIPARLARAYDRATLEGDLIEILVTPA